MTIKERVINFLEKEISATEAKLEQWKTELEAMKNHQEAPTLLATGDPVPPDPTKPKP